MPEEKETLSINTSQIGGAADGISKGLVRIGNLGASGVLSIIAVVGVFVTGGVLVYTSIMDRNDKKEERLERREEDASKLRDFNSQREIDRQNFATEREKDRQHSNNQLKMVLDHQSKEGERNTERIITAIKERHGP